MTSSKLSVVLSRRLIKSPHALLQHRLSDRVSIPLWPGRSQKLRRVESGMTVVSRDSVFLDHVGAFFRGHNDGRIDIRRRHSRKN